MLWYQMFEKRVTMKITTTMKIIFCRSYGVVPNVWVRDRSLDAEGDRACAGLCAVQSRLLLSLPRLCLDGRQRDEDVHHYAHRAWTLPSVRPRWESTVWNFLSTFISHYRKMYTIMPTEPGHYLQYDQGESLYALWLIFFFTFIQRCG
jgi:hypothetical protein